MESKDDMRMPPRPGSAMSRPGTANGRPGIGFSKFSEELKSTNAIIKSHMVNDSLLRIMDEKKSSTDNEALVMAETGNLNGLKRLLQNGEDLVSVRGMGGYSVLHHACNRGHVAIVNELLKAHFPIAIKCDSGETPLHLAVYSGNMLIVEQLIDCGADVDAQNDYNETPLFYAARRSYPALVRLLMQRGADVSAVDKFGETAVEQATSEHTRRAFEKAQRIESRGSLPYNELLLVFRYLTAKEVCRAACVSGKWHRASENEGIWTALGIRRWECALQSSLGFGHAPMASFRMRRPSRDASQKSKPTSR